MTSIWPRTAVDDKRIHLDEHQSPLWWAASCKPTEHSIEYDAWPLWAGLNNLLVTAQPSTTDVHHYTNALWDLYQPILPINSLTRELLTDPCNNWTANDRRHELIAAWHCTLAPKFDPIRGGRGFMGWLGKDGRSRLRSWERDRRAGLQGTTEQHRCIIVHAVTGALEAEGTPISDATIASALADEKFRHRHGIKASDLDLRMLATPTAIGEIRMIEQATRRPGVITGVPDEDNWQQVGYLDPGFAAVEDDLSPRQSTNILDVFVSSLTPAEKRALQRMMDTTSGAPSDSDALLVKSFQHRLAAITRDLLPTGVEIDADDHVLSALIRGAQTVTDRPGRTKRKKPTQKAPAPAVIAA